MEAIHVQIFTGQPFDGLPWDECVASAKSKHLEQTTAWAETRLLDGWNPAYLVARRNDRIVGGALVLTRRIKRFLDVGYVSRGPLIWAESDVEEQEVAEAMVRELKSLSQAKGLTVLVVDPPYYAGLLPAALARAGFTPHLQDLPPTGLMKGALLIDLTQPEEELLKGLRRSTRQLLRKAEQEPALHFREGGFQDIDLLWKLMNELCSRRGVRPNVSNPAVIRVLWERLSRGKNIRIDVLEFNGQPLTAVMTVCVGRWAIPWRIGWSGAEARLNPEKILYWNLIRALKNAGYTTFDFNWIDPSEAEALRSGKALESGANTGITAFKIGFGGEIVKVNPPMDYFPNPIFRTAAKLGLDRFAKSRLLRKFLSTSKRTA